jgi:hypothetical protein
MPSRSRLAALIAGAVTLTSLVLATPATAAGTPDGSTPERAAASCWEIKQNDRTATDGVYWLVTPALQAPTKFWCDQTTDGGGWVMVARGRHGWVEGAEGRGTPASLTGTPTGPSAFYAKQLPARTIDALLDGGRVDTLPDGIRLRRAAKTDGSTYQEIRVKLASRDRWTWALAADPGIPVKSYSVGSSTTTKSQTTRLLKISTDTQRIFTGSSKTNDYVRGFTFGKAGPRGTTSDASYLYSSASGGRYATPFTQMYLRPKLRTSALTYPAVRDAGTASQAAPAIPESGALPTTWGVTGLGRGGSLYYATEVSAFAQIGNRMYVGGNFTQVRNAAGSRKVSQPYLAAFDATSGEWIPGFRPELDNQVKALVALPGGRLAVGGEFTRAGGTAASGLVALDATTGRRDTGFRADLTQSTKGAKRWVRALAVSGGHLYVGGGFTSYSGGTTKKSSAYRNIVRVDPSDGTPRSDWRPNLATGVKIAKGKRSLSSSVLSLDVSDDGATIYAAGQFQQGYVGADGKSSVSRPGAAAIRTSAPATFRSWSVKSSTSKASRRYQQAVRQIGDRVWLGGSQHSLFGYTASALTLVSSHLALGGGDMQAIASRAGIAYASCHCNEWLYSGTSHFDKPRASGYKQVARIGYVGAWDSATGTYLPEFAPTSKTRGGEGPWALLSAADGTLWSGGDYVSVVNRDGTNQWAGGFVRFAMRPHTPPAPPSGVTVSLSNGKAYVSWSASPTADVSYEILRNDRVVGVTSTGSVSTAIAGSTTGDRWFVRATDGRGNRSASTPVATAG